jgi:hypothetical protein
VGVFDTRPRQPTDSQIAMLTDLASVAVEFWSCTVTENNVWDLPATLPRIPALACPRIAIRLSFTGGRRIL